VHQGTITHTYPFCYRSETPLIYKAVPSWFIDVPKIKDQVRGVGPTLSTVARLHTLCPDLRHAQSCF